MKFILTLLVLTFTFNVSAKPLSCSANGTDVYYINGVLTNKDKNSKDTAATGALFDLKKEQLDSGKNIKFTGIYNPSFGLINDVAELFSQAYFAKTGKDDGKAIFNLVRNMPETAGTATSAFDPTGLGNVLGIFGYSNTINFATLIKEAKEDFITASIRSLASTDTVLKEKDAVVKSVATNYTLSKNANRKILFVAHSQGNAVLEAALKKLPMSQQTEIDYMSKFMGVYHVASPVPPLVSPYNSRNIRSEQDKIIAAAKIFSATLPPEFQITVAPITHSVTSRSLSSPDDWGHLFADTYISSGVFIRPLNSNATPVAMSENFVTTLSDLATDLQDNCLMPVIGITSANAIYNQTDDVFEVDGYAGLARVINVLADDVANYPDVLDGIDTMYVWSFNQFNVKAIMLAM